MSRLSLILRFLAVVVTVLGLTHVYFWTRLVRATALPPPWKQLVTAAIIVLGVGLPLTLVVQRLVGPQAARLIAWPENVWMGMMVYLLFLLLAGDLMFALVALGGRALGAAAADPERRLMLRQLLAGAAAVGAGAIGIFGIRSALGPVAIKEIEVELPRLPAALDGTTIVQLTDVHVGTTIGREFIETIVAQTNRLNPDLIAITGDLVDGSVDALRHAISPLAGLRARLGVYFVTGNHEYYSGAEDWVAELGRLGIRVLRNERVGIGEGAASFDLAGIDDFASRDLAPGHGPDLPRALAGRDASRALVLLAHQPKAVFEAARHGVDLQLSGHTHGGQLWPWGWLVRLQQPYVAGLVRHEGTQLYVSRGTGYWGPPMRVGAPAEITKIVLKSSRA